MNRIIRKSIPQDALHFERIKKQLPLPTDQKNSKKGGFLLGTDIGTYKFYIKNGICLTALVNDRVVGFGIILPNRLVKKSAIWEKRKTANWEIDINELEKSKISYFEQLAFLSGERRLSIQLAYNLVKSSFELGAEFVLTTTVIKPIINLASIPYIKAVGGFKAGNIDESYHLVGDLNSDIYLIEKSSFYEKVKHLPFYDFLEPNNE